MRDPGRLVVLGGGPTGLGAAYRASELGLEDFTVVEARPTPGGLAGSYLDQHGFTWDIGGHVQFSHYDYYDAVLDRALGDGWLERERESWVWVRGCWVPYPFQYNLHRLPPADRDRALAGLEQSSGRGCQRAAHFGEWIDSTFGEGISALFMRPYNQKVWGFPLETLAVEWIGDRVAVPDLERVRRNAREQRDDVSWGPNNHFRYPRQGGTGAIWKGVTALLDPHRLQFGVAAMHVALDERRVRLSDGRVLPYDRLISTLPLDVLCRMSDGLSPAARRAATALRYSSCHVVGVGVRGDRPASLERKCWMYFPGSSSPYYRVTVLSNYSPFNVPPGDGYWSLLAEVCETSARPVDAARLEAWTLAAMRADGLLGTHSRIASVWHRREEHGYPTPFLGRDDLLTYLRPELEGRGVYSRGRFGAWKYEVSNQDHSFMQGVEVVNHLLDIGGEPTLEQPGWVNSGAFRFTP